MHFRTHVLVSAILLLFLSSGSSLFHTIELNPIPVEKPWGMSRNDIALWDKQLGALLPDDSSKPILWGEFWFGDNDTHPNRVLRNIGSDRDQFQKFAGTTTTNKLWGWYAGNFTVLMKYLYSGSGLSLHYHWDPAELRCNTLQKEIRDEPGKVEIWYILDADPGAGILVGLRPEITGDEFLNAFLRASAAPQMTNQDVAKLRSLLQFVEVSSGDVLMMAPGLVHSIGGSASTTSGGKVAMIEVMHNSDSIIRLSDWERALPSRKILRDTNDPVFRESDAKLLKGVSEQLQSFILRAKDLNSHRHSVPGGYVTVLVDEFYGLHVERIEAVGEGVSSDELKPTNTYRTILYVEGCDLEVEAQDVMIGRSFVMSAGQSFRIRPVDGSRSTALVAWLEPEALHLPLGWLKRQCGN